MSETYEERVLKAIEDAVIEQALDWNPTRSTAEGDQAIILVDPATDLMYLVEVQLI